MDETQLRQLTSWAAGKDLVEFKFDLGTINTFLFFVNLLDNIVTMVEVTQD